ncbi:MAG: UDP-N-acetylmuramoyl-L-alanine--D-glutamate ligase [Rhodothermales bacterium]
MKANQVAGKRVTVVGAARSGIAVSKLLNEASARVFLTEFKAGSSDQISELNAAGVAFEFGGHTPRALEADFVVVSPGVPSTIPLLVEAVEKGIPIFSEIEVAFWFCQAPIVAITGSNGKTTTTSLAAHVFAHAGRTVHVAGNIGKAFSDITKNTSSNDVVILEVSSFQLDHIDTFRPDISVLLNITPDHLDRYGYQFENYAASKFRIFENQTSEDTLIYCYDDLFVRNKVEQLAHPDAKGSTKRPNRVKTLGISQEQEIRDGAFLRESDLVIRFKQEEEFLMRKEELALKGPHNVYNSLAAAMAARVMEIPNLFVRESLSSFEGVAHRLELVREVNGVRYINDSKATNVNAVWYALESFRENIILIAGGRDKGNDYTSLKPLIQRNVRMVIAIGESADKVDRELGELAEQHLIMNTLEEAVHTAHLLAKSGEVVLLSPACASFDMFNNYEERGDVFKSTVMNL